MVRLDWVTPERIWESLDVLMVVIAVGLGILNMYLWLEEPSVAVIFGLDLYLLVGTSWFVVALLSLSAWRFRSASLYSR